jgi:hypothetical protein
VVNDISYQFGNIFILSHRRGEKKKMEKIEGGQILRISSKENFDLDFGLLVLLYNNGRTTVQGTVIVPHTFCILIFFFRFCPPIFCFKPINVACYTIE